MSSNTAIRFAPTRADFFNTLNRRVNEHFKSNNISRHGNTEMKVKTAFMCSMFWIPFLLIMFSVVTNPWGMLGLCLVMGVGMAGIGLSVMHDANHGAYSSKSCFNELLGISLTMVGCNSLTRRVPHTVRHHTSSKSQDWDEDSSPRGRHRSTAHG